MIPLPAKEITVTLPQLPHLFPSSTAEEKFVSFRQVHLFLAAAPPLCSREHSEGVLHGTLDRIEPDPGTNS
jgi:hypothetical protein